MSDRERHIQHLFAAELQFRLPSAVRLAVTGNRQPLDLPKVEKIPPDAVPVDIERLPDGGIPLGGDTSSTLETKGKRTMYNAA